MSTPRNKSAYHGRRERYTVKHLPPPWKRSLTESGMSRLTTPLDRFVVAIFFVLLVVALVWGVQGSPT
jgi:hypothetical protein